MKTTAILFVAATSTLGGCGSFIVDPTIRTYGYASEAPTMQTVVAQTTLDRPAERSVPTACVKNAETASMMQNMVTELDRTGSVRSTQLERQTLDLPVAASGLFILPETLVIPVIDIKEISTALMASAV